MAVDFLQGIDWGVAGNWQSAAVPVDNDEVAIPGTLGAAVTGTPDQGGVDLDLLRIHKESAHDLFTTGAPLQISADLVEHYGRGGLYYKCDGNGAGRKTDLILIQCGNPRVITELNSLNGDLGEFTAMIFNRGTIRILGDTAWDVNGLVQIGHVDDPSGDVKLTIAQGADTLPELRQGGGQCFSNRAITVAYTAGMLQQDVAAIAALHIVPGGHVIYNHTSATTVIVHRGAVLDLMGNTVEKTITDLWGLPGSTVHYDKGLHTFTNKRTGYDFYDYRTEQP